VIRIFRNFEEAGKNIRNPVVTTGSFDGVHIGHKTIINRLKMLAQKHDGESVLVTFYPHPRKVLYPDTAGKDLRLIYSQEEKLELLWKAGLDNVIIIEFTREFSKITSEEFVRDLLVGKLHAKVIVAGFNHHFGFNKEGDYRQLWKLREKYNFEAEEIPEQEVQHETVSSTRIRKAISEGYIQRANAYLDHYYLIMGIPVAGEDSLLVDNKKFCRVPVTDENKLIPAEGIYAVSIETDAETEKGMVLIEKRKDSEYALFLHISNEKMDISGQHIFIYFHKKITGSIDLSDTPKSLARFRAAADEISDLIY
jgi:riboflavin kinase / FMN adenylyltransferase